MARNLYGPGVRMGNWNEDIYLEEELMKDFLEKRDKGELLIQKNRRMKNLLLRPVQLSVTEDGCVHFGDRVMLVSPHHPEPRAQRFLPGDLSLCLAPEEIQARLTDRFQLPCGLSAAPTRAPVRRNAFAVLSVDREAVGDVLRFGQNFRLGITLGCEDRTLYLSSDHRTLLRSSSLSSLQEVYLTDEDSYLNCWQAAFPDPQLRLEWEGQPVPANTRILINHSHTNRGLAVHRHLFLRSYFGKEAEVAAHTHLDTHRVEMPRNHWMLVTGSPRGAASTMLDVPRPPAERGPAPEPGPQ
ncbi:cilia- and flagella-associated protein 161 [Pipistrellus kuhlii]|uniref:Cilia and flagella associated protein 161 n=1 Tax=Pipistrellus kuhlii TaxID=59472 RepID=A0A7J7QUJ6_PIPKU|nr:cilia- and flagella-associated protein 161 [Pipistrellus kuhlii]KAF6267512.1 cilia and flagella associated protein 161 [Pipistrellus kuhlii]